MKLHFQLVDASNSQLGTVPVIGHCCSDFVTTFDSQPTSRRGIYSPHSPGAIPGKTYGSQPISPSCRSSRHKNSLHRLRNAGVRTSLRTTHASNRPLDRQMANLHGLRCEFPAREKACINRDHSELAQGCIAPPERSKCQSTPAVWAGDYPSNSDFLIGLSAPALEALQLGAAPSISLEVLGGARFFSGGKS